jgi:hypothetical protein
MGTLLRTFFTAKAWVSRMANKMTTATITTPIAAASHSLRRRTDWEAID